ncbi:MAG: efflux RND transporter periplasmic adaptor subunit [Labrys sp. (in: a-proteobacteria)]
MRLWKQVALLILLAGAGFGFFQAYQMFVAPRLAGSPAGPPGAGGPPVAGGAPAGQPPAGMAAGGTRSAAGMGQPAPGGQGGGAPGGGAPGAGAPGAGGGAGRGGPAGPTLIEAADVTSGPIRLMAEAVGTTLARQAVDVVPLAAGRIVSIAVEPGRAVKTGDVLFELDKDIERANLMEAEAKLREATLALERADSLRKNKAIADAQFEQATSLVVTSQAEVDRANRRLADRVVRAPFDGIVGLKRVEIGESVTTQTVLTTLDDLSEVEIEFSLSEVLFEQVKIGQAVIANAAAFPGRRFEGTVRTIDSRVDPASRSFRVRATIPNRELVLPAGMFVHLSLVLNERTALTVPEEALLVQGGKSFVFVLSDGKVARRPVELGQRDVGTIEILSGVAAGERIVTRGVQKLRDGASVQEKGAAPPAAAEAKPVAAKPSGS